MKTTGVSDIPKFVLLVFFGHPIDYSISHPKVWDNPQFSLGGTLPPDLAQWVGNLRWFGKC